MLLSAALIVRDEAGFLDGCLASLAGLVDEIVVVDTGSVDDTVDIARRHGAVVGHHPWNRDFAAARNHSLDLASGEWVLYVDADERVRPGDHAAARAALADRPDLLAGMVPFVPRVGWTPYLEYRLWRSRPDVRFRGAMHETIIPALAAVARDEGLAIEAWDHVTIDHLGYEGDQSHKRERDEPMLLAAIAEQPTRSFLYDHLARVYEGAGELERAVATWTSGIAAARARGFDHPEDCSVFANLFSHCFVHGGVDDRLGSLIEESIAAFPGVPPLELAAARYEFATGRISAAVPRLERLVTMRTTDIVATGNSYDARIFGEWAWDLLGLCRFASDDDTGAAAAFARAEEAAPGVAQYAVHRKLAEARARDRS